MIGAATGRSRDGHRAPSGSPGAARSTPRAAREHVRVARRIPELPLIRAAFSRGERLSPTRRCGPSRVWLRTRTSGELLELASFLHRRPAGALGAPAYRRVTTEEASEQQEDACLSVFWEPDGSLSIHGRLAPEDGALLLRALDAVRDSLWNRDRGSAEPRPARQASNAEALVAVAEAALAQPDGSRPGGERYQVVVHADEAVLFLDEGDGGCELRRRQRGQPLRLRAGWPATSSVVRNRRKRRTIPPALRRRCVARWLPFSRLREPSLPRRHHVHHSAKAARDGRQPRAALSPPPPAGRRRRLERPPAGAVHQLLGTGVPGRAFAPAQPSGSAPRHATVTSRSTSSVRAGTWGALDLAAAVDAALSIAAQLPRRNGEDTPSGH